MSERIFQATNEGGVEVKPTAEPEVLSGPGPMTFSTHILSLNAAALLQMGLIPDPEGATQKDLEAARHIIDTLAVLRDKTRGNLTPEESSLLDTVLHELRIRFVQVH